MHGRHEVVIVDGLPETEEVLRAVFEPRGLDVVRVSASAAQRHTQSDDARVLVVHGDEDDSMPPAVSGGTDVPRVLIGRLTLPESDSANAHCRCLPQPFQYADLIAAVMELTTRSP